MGASTATVIKAEDIGDVRIQWYQDGENSYGVEVVDTIHEKNTEIKDWKFESVVAEPVSFWWYDYAVETTKLHQAQEDTFLDIPVSLMDAEIGEIDAMICTMMASTQEC